MRFTEERESVCVCTKGMPWDFQKVRNSMSLVVVVEHIFIVIEAKEQTQRVCVQRVCHGVPRR